MTHESPVLDPAAIERLRALAVAVARPGEDICGHLTPLFTEDSAARQNGDDFSSSAFETLRDTKFTAEHDVE